MVGVTELVLLYLDEHCIVRLDYTVMVCKIMVRICNDKNK